VEQVSVEAAARMMGAGEPVQLVDCREGWEVEICVLPGAQRIPLGEIVERAGELDPAVPVLVYCHHGVRSINGAILLERLGFRTMSLRGGIDAWSDRIDPSVPRY
jgi:rhodanese-related sulfurtransferase